MTERRQQRNLSPRDCPSCGERFLPYRDAQRACSRKCREALGPIPEGERGFTIPFTCRLCGTVGEARTTLRGGRRNFCNDCQPRAASERAARKNAARQLANVTDPDARCAINRKQLLATRYGLTPECYDKMLKKQRGVCAICGKAPDPNGVKAASRLHVDHDHATGAVRSLLCNRCNQGVGYFLDDPDLLRKAARYIQRHRS